jgi:hypothetical protein
LIYTKRLCGLAFYGGTEHLTENHLRKGRLLGQVELKLGFSGATVLVVSLRKGGHKKT